MVSYRPFYETLFKKNVTEYQLIFKQGISANSPSYEARYGYQHYDY